MRSEACSPVDDDSSDAGQQERVVARQFPVAHDTRASATTPRRALYHLQLLHPRRRGPDGRRRHRRPRVRPLAGLFGRHVPGRQRHVRGRRRQVRVLPGLGDEGRRQGYRSRLRRCPLSVRTRCRRFHCHRRTASGARHTLRRHDAGVRRRDQGLLRKAAILTSDICVDVLDVF